MPVITIDWWSGSSETSRATVVQQVTDVVSKAAGCPEEAVTVIIRETDPAYWGKGGALASHLASGAGDATGEGGGPVPEPLPTG